MTTNPTPTKNREQLTEEAYGMVTRNPDIGVQVRLSEFLIGFRLGWKACEQKLVAEAPVGRAPA